MSVCTLSRCGWMSSKSAVASPWHNSRISCNNKAAVTQNHKSRKHLKRPPYVISIFISIHCHILGDYIKKKITLQFLKCHDNDRAHPCSEAQGELGPLTSVEKLWNNVCNHGNKLLKHPIISHNSLLEGLPHGCWEQPDRRDQESQSGEGERGTWMVTQAG